jgi:cytochrome b involved in lipid metabolism
LLWTIIDGDVYDITNYVSMHPGGKKKIMRGAGKDSTDMFYQYHPGLKINRTPLALLKIGEITSLKPDVS